MTNLSILGFNARSVLALGIVLPLIACGGGNSEVHGAGVGAMESASLPAPVSKPTTPTDPRVAKALATSDSGSVDTETLMSATLNLLQDRVTEHASRLRAVFSPGLVGINWNPTADSVYLTALDAGRNAVLLNSNWRYTGSVTGGGRALAVLGVDPQTGARYAAFGGNPLAVRGNAAMDGVLRNTLTWLTGRSNLNALKVVMAHLPCGSVPSFAHEAPTRSWLMAEVSNVKINGVNGHAAVDDSCDGDRLGACLSDANLLVVGAQEGPDSGSSTYDGAQFMNAVKAAQARGIPVLYLHHRDGVGDLSTRLLDHFGLGFESNKSTQEGMKTFDPAGATGGTALTDLQALLGRLQSGTFSTTWSGCETIVGRVDCANDTALQTEFLATASAIRSALRTLDAKGVDLFDQPGFVIERHLVLLGDTYRRGVTYPMDKDGNRGVFFRALFSDMTAYNNRRVNATALNQGTFAPAIDATTPTISRTVSTTAPETRTLEYMTGLYVLPGRTVTIQRTDTAPATVKLRINMLRNTTRLYNPNRYDRPTMLGSPLMPLAAGQTVRLTSPFGGPLYLSVDPSPGAPQVTVTVDGVITHPVLRNMRDAAEAAVFKAEVASTPTNWVGITTDFLTLHSTLTHMRTTLASHGQDVTLLADRTWTYMIKDSYELAGFNSAAGVLSLPQTVTNFCTAAGWDCNGTQHRRDLMQHVIADSSALCGAACAGNPYDQNDEFQPLGWTESHELGHNLQRQRMSIYGRAGEVSNLIFPIHKWMAFNQANPQLTERRARPEDTAMAFAVIKDSLQPGASPTHMFDTIWSNTELYANISERLVFYRQLVEFARHYNANFVDGWELYTLIYLLDRNFSAAGPGWASARSSLGFGTYNTYPSSINPNDFMLIATSRIIGRDMRAVWNLYGITFSAAAAAQVAAYSLPSAEPMMFPMPHLSSYGSAIGTPIRMTPTATYPAGF